jgi:putative SOS response-associated peptidase YedK
MCGRYVLKRKDLEALLERLGVKNPAEYISRYNIAPSTMIPAVRTTPDANAREAVALQWGLVPRWSKDAKSGAKLANARAEGIASKPAFRDAFKQRRCVVPASGFYEWQTIGRLKQPWFFQMRDESPFVFAGLWERWRSEDGVELQTCSLITTSPNDVVSPLHDRMPVILREGAIDLWLDPTTKDAAQLESVLAPVPSELMKATPVSANVNSVRNEGPELIEPATPLTGPAPSPQMSLGLE